MYDLLLDFTRRPAPFSRYTAKELWTRPHLAQQMLKYHLNQDTDLASRRIESIDRIVDYIDQRVGVSGKNVCDLGCGPGLYAKRFSLKGAKVTGVDFSANSLKYARSQSGDDVEYIEADYLTDDLPTDFDLITLIYTDYCVLSPEQRRLLLGRIHKMLKPDGKLILDVATTAALADKRETMQMEEQLMDGYWAPGKYLGIQKSLIYTQEKLALDRYLIIEPDNCWQIFNWFQHFTPQGIADELNNSRFEVIEMKDGFTDAEITSETKLIGIIASAE